jgi:hypothetical protein
MRARNRAICPHFGAYLTPTLPVATYYGYHEACAGLRHTLPVRISGFRAHDRQPDRVSLPGPIQHSTAMLHPQVAGEGHNNKEFAP